MSDIVQLYSDKPKTKKAYPKTLASETYMSNGGTVESQLAQIESKNIEQDTRLKDIENRNKVQDVYINGFFNENKSDRLTVEGEGNDLKLEGSKEGLVTVDKVVGNTFVNIANFSDKEYEFTLNSGQYYNTITLCDLSLIEVNTDYTLLFDIEIVNNTTTWSLGSNTKFVLGQGNSQNTVSGHPVINSISNNGISYNLWNTICYSTNVVKFNLLSLNTTYTKYFAIRPLYSEQLGEGQSITYKVKNLMLFKGDITSNPPKEYIEGLKSSFEENLVTQDMIDKGLEDAENLGKYKVPIRIVAKNKFDNQVELGYINNGQLVDSNLSLRSINFTLVQSNKNYVLNSDTGNIIAGSIGINYYDYNKQFISSLFKPLNSKFTTPSNCRYIKLNYNIDNIDLKFQLEEGTVATDYEEYFERTANVYLNSPILEGDEIVEYNGELCHYHKCKKETLDGSDDEKWVIDSNYSTDLVKRFSIKGLANRGNRCYAICDKFTLTTINYNTPNHRCFFGSAVGGGFLFDISSSSLSTPNVAGFKEWLQQNPVTVVYELAEPYYEPIKADKLLLECANDSTIHIESIVPVENIVASYTTGIPNAYLLQETNDNQDSLIDISLCATDEMYTMIEPLLEVVPQTLNNERMTSKMVDMYVAMVIRGLKTIEEVPVRYRKEVQTILDKLEE